MAFDIRQALCQVMEHQYSTRVHVSGRLFSKSGYCYYNFNLRAVIKFPGLKNIQIHSHSIKITQCFLALLNLY